MADSKGSADAWQATPPGIEDVEVIDHGGFATVYTGWQPDFHRRVAVKVLHADADDPAVRARFDREVRAMGALSDHPDVVTVYDAGVHAGRPYLVMPYLPGGSLADELAAGPLEPAEVVVVGAAMANALDAAHRTGLLHRDVKPANILRTASGEPKLADFGVARFADATATYGYVALTVAFAAPEVLNGGPATVASDIYSLGATMHALLRGAPPFAVPEDATPLVAAVRAIESDPPDLRADGVPDELAAVVERAMAKDPAARFATAADLRQALLAASLAAPAAPDEATVAQPVAEPTWAAVPVAPAPVPPAAPVRAPASPRPVDRPRRPNAALVAAVAVALVLLVAGGAWLAERGDGDGETAVSGPSTTAAPAAEESVGGPASVEPAPASSTTASTTATTTTTSTVASPAPAGSPVEAARHYFAVLDGGDVDEGWSLLSPAYQEASGYDSYRGFWSTISSVDVLDAQPVGDDAVRVSLRYVRTDGSTTSETNTLGFVTGDDGRLLVDRSG